MKNKLLLFINTKKYNMVFLLICMFMIQMSTALQAATPLRRAISPSSPMWIIHIDTWNYADPQKIINLIPADIKPYVVMDVSLSISHDSATHRFKVAEYGYEIAKSWVRTCAENQMWCMVQPASGGMHQFSEFDLSVYEEFFRDYPNFLGFNFAEQFWGFDDPIDPVSAKWTDRMNLFANLLKMSNKYGGYLVVSWCGNQWSPSINPIGMMKRNPAFAAACRDYTENYILCEKYTQISYQSDMESVCLGAYLSGYSGQYGIRYDNTGWTNSSGTNANFTLATAGAPHLEHMMLTGETVIDGPEIIWQNCFKENNTSSTPDGFTKRNWGTFAHFDNVMIEMFRKVLDGTVRIPSRKEVINRTKVAIINDVNSTDINATYSSPQTLFEGLYRMDGDGNYENNKTFFKKTGRYPTIPTVYLLDDADANSFQIKLNRSAYNTRWPSVASKVAELNTYFPQEYTGDLYAGRNENAWVTYNPYKIVKIAKASIPFKYNTCDSMSLTYSQYTAGVVKEYADKVTFYLSNYDDEVTTGLKGDTIKIFGSTQEPTWSYIERGNHKASTITKTWANGVFMLSILHNGAVDISVNCSGTGTNRLTSYTTASLIAPDKPTIYTGPRQYEAECFDRKNVSNVVAGGYDGTIRNYTGQGYVRFGTSSAASVRDTVNVPKSGVYKFQIKYSTLATVSTVDLYVNGTKVSTPTFNQTATESAWSVYTQNITLNSGNNVIMLKAKATGAANINFDNFVLVQGNGETIYDFTNDVATSGASVPAAQYVAVQSGSAGVISYTDANNLTSNCIKPYSTGNINGTGAADLNLFPTSAANYYVVWKEFFGSTGAKKGVLLRGTGTNGACAYADGMKQGYLFVTQNNNDNTVTLIPNIATATGLTEKTNYTSKFTVGANQPCWYRASVQDSLMVFECSKDSVNWEGATVAKFTDKTYSAGSTQLIWGFNANNNDWLMDNIFYNFKTFSVSKYQVSGLGYNQGDGIGKADSISVQGKGLTDNLAIACPGGFEVSLSKSTGYSSALIVNQSAGSIAPTNVYVRAKAGLSPNTYSGIMTISASGLPNQSISLSATVIPTPFTKLYNFTTDVASTSAQTPPALNATIGAGNAASAGVVNYTDSKSITSNVIKPYSCGSRNSTGVIDLNSFSKSATDYSVTWKQCVLTGSEYKVGVLLRGDNSNVATDVSGYEAGLMNGYLFIVDTKTTGGSEFRIYKSSSSTTLNRVNTGLAGILAPTDNQPVWYRASVSGTTSVSLKFEYSIDSITWKPGTTYTDTTTPYTSGSTQLVWGLGLNSVNFYIDNITFNGIETGGSTELESLISDEGATIVATEYYTITGQRVLNYRNTLKGLYIVRNILSNGKVKASKVFFN